MISSQPKFHHNTISGLSAPRSLWHHAHTVKGIALVGPINVFLVFKCKTPRIIGTISFLAQRKPEQPDRYYLLSLFRVSIDIFFSLFATTELVSTFHFRSIRHAWLFHVILREHCYLTFPVSQRSRISPDIAYCPCLCGERAINRQVSVDMGPLFQLSSYYGPLGAQLAQLDH